MQLICIGTGLAAWGSRAACWGYRLKGGSYVRWEMQVRPGIDRDFFFIFFCVRGGVFRFGCGEG